MELIQQATIYLSPVALVAAGAFALFQYWYQHHWRVSEFAAAQERRFREDRHAMGIVELFYYDSPSILLRPEFVNLNAERAFECVTAGEAVTAMKNYDSLVKLTEKEIRILAAVDHFLEELSIIQLHLESKLVRDSHYKFYFKYYCDLVWNISEAGNFKRKGERARSRLSEEARLAEAISNFAVRWEYDGACKLFTRWEKDC